MLSALRSPLSALRSPLSALRAAEEPAMRERILAGLIPLLSLAVPSTQAQVETQTNPAGLLAGQSDDDRTPLWPLNPRFTRGV